MNVVGKFGSLITRGVYSVATPFHPFGGAVDIIVVEQQDGSFRSTPWYIRFGKFQGVLKGSENIVGVSVNGSEANFHMFLDNSGEAYFLREALPGGDMESDDQDSKVSDSFISCYGDDVLGKIEDEQLNVSIVRNEDVGASGSSHGLEDVQVSADSEDSNSEMVLMSVEGYVIKAPITEEEGEMNDVQLSIPKFHLGPADGSGEDFDDGDVWTAGLFYDLDSPSNKDTRISENQNEIGIERGTDCTGECMNKDRDMFKSCLDLTAQIECSDPQDACSLKLGLEKRVESACLQESSSIDTKLEDAKSNADHRLRHSGLKSFDITSSADIQADACSNSDQHLNDSETRSLEMENTLHEGSVVSPVQSISIETECAAEEENNKLSSSEAQISGFGFEISLCGDIVQPGIGHSSAAEAFETHRISENAFMTSGREIIKNGKLIVRYRDEYFTWDNIAHIILGKSIFGMRYSVEPTDPIPIEQREISKAKTSPTSSHRWRLWPNPFRRINTFKHSDSDSPKSEDVFLDSKPCFESTSDDQTQSSSNSLSPKKQLIRTNIPTSEQIASLNLKDGQNTVAFSYSTRVLGTQQVEAHIYLWKWNTRIVISDVDGTITRSDVLGQVMPLVGRDWTQSGVARLFSAIKENGYQLLFLSARAIVQAYLTKSYLFNLKQDGKALPTGPVVISPDGLFPSLYREIIRRAPHEFKIACLKDIRALFPTDYNPFYAGFGNRDTDELSYRKIGIPKGKIFIINPKGEVAHGHCTDVRSYTSLHTLVHDMFPPTSLAEQEDFNSWNYWKLPLPTIEDDS